MATDKYVQARIAYAKAEREANELNDDIAFFLKDWKNIKITNGGKVKGRGEHVFTRAPLDLSKWPSREEVTRILTDYIQAYNGMMAEWDQLGKDERAAVQSPLP